MYLTHIDPDGSDSPAILIDNSTAANRAVNLPEFVNIPPTGCASSAAGRRILPLYDRALYLEKHRAHRGVHRPLEADCRARSRRRSRHRHLAEVLLMADAVTRRPRTFKRPGSSSCAPPPRTTSWACCFSIRAASTKLSWSFAKRSNRNRSPSSSFQPGRALIQRDSPPSAARTPQGARTGPPATPRPIINSVCSRPSEVRPRKRSASGARPSIWIPTMLQPTTLWPMRSTREVRPPRRYALARGHPSASRQRPGAAARGLGAGHLTRSIPAQRTEALAFAVRAMQLSGGKDPAILDALAAAYAETNRFADAALTARRRPRPGPARPSRSPQEPHRPLRSGQAVRQPPPPR